MTKTIRSPHPYAITLEQAKQISDNLKRHYSVQGTVMMPTIEQYERLRRTLESRAVKLMGPRSPFWRCEYCQALSQTPIGFQHKPECVIAALPVEPTPTRGGPTEKHPNAPYCKPDQSCCDFCCGN